MGVIEIEQLTMVKLQFNVIVVHEANNGLMGLLKLLQLEGVSGVIQVMMMWLKLPTGVTYLLVWVQRMMFILRWIEIWAVCNGSMSSRILMLEFDWAFMRFFTDKFPSVFSLEDSFVIEILACLSTTSPFCVNRQCCAFLSSLLMSLKIPLCHLYAHACSEDRVWVPYVQLINQLIVSRIWRTPINSLPYFTCTTWSSQALGLFQEYSCLTVSTGHAVFS